MTAAEERADAALADLVRELEHYRDALVTPREADLIRAAMDKLASEVQLLAVGRAVLEDRLTAAADSAALSLLREIVANVTAFPNALEVTSGTGYGETGAFDGIAWMARVRALLGEEGALQGEEFIADVTTPPGATVTKGTRK